MSRIRGAALDHTEKLHIKNLIHWQKDDNNRCVKFVRRILLERAEHCVLAESDTEKWALQSVPELVDEWHKHRLIKIALRRVFAGTQFCDAMQKRLDASPGDEATLQVFFEAVLRKAPDISQCKEWADQQWILISASPRENRTALKLAPMPSNWVSDQVEHFIKTRAELFRFFIDPILWEKALQLIKTNLIGGLVADADDCLAFVYITLLRRALSFNPSQGNLEQWVFGGIPDLVLEWLKARKGREVMNDSSHESGSETSGPALPASESSRQHFYEFIERCCALIAFEDFNLRDLKLMRQRYLEKNGDFETAKDKEYRPDPLVIETAKEIIGNPGKHGSGVPKARVLLDVLKGAGLVPFPNETAAGFAQRAAEAVQKWMKAAAPISSNEKLALATFWKLEKLQLANSKLLWLRFRDGMEHLETARAMGYRPNTAEIIERAKKIIDNPGEQEDRVPKARALLDELARAGQTPLLKETATGFAQRVGEALHDWTKCPTLIPEQKGALATIRKLEEVQIANRAKQQIHRLIKKMKELICADEAASEFADDILTGLAERGEIAPEVRGADVNDNLFWDDELGYGEKEPPPDEQPEDDEGEDGNRN